MEFTREFLFDVEAYRVVVMFPEVTMRGQFVMGCIGELEEAIAGVHKDCSVF